MASPTIGETLQRLLHSYRRVLRSAHDEGATGLSIPLIRTLKSVDTLVDCTAGAIVARTLIEKAQVTRALNALLAAELVVKRDNPADGRSTFIDLTSTGIDMVRQIREVETAAIGRLSAGLTPDEVAEFIRLADRMLENLEPGS